MDPGIIFRSVELCAECIIFIIDTCKTYNAADEEVSERIAIVEDCWNRTRLQYEFVQSLTPILDAEHRRILDNVLGILASKLSSAVTSLKAILEKRERDGGVELRPGFFGFSRGVRKGKYAFVKDALDGVIRDLEEWQRRFDPSWFLIMRMANPAIDQQLRESREQSQPLQRQPDRNPARASPRPRPAPEQPSSRRRLQHQQRHLEFTLATGHQAITSPLLLADDIRTALRPHSHRESIFFREVFDFMPIPYCRAKAAHRRGFSDRWFILDPIIHRPGMDIEIMKSDIRVLAHKLSRADPLAFGLLNCKGVNGNVDSHDPSRILSFDLILRIPSGMEVPQSLRQMLLLYPKADGSALSINRRLRIAQELARSVSYVHTFSFVHKSISPESILILEDFESSRSATFLVGFDQFRSADGDTNLLGDSNWDRNLYRHPARQGDAPEDAYCMQHDIYSLGACLLEIGLWESFVGYPADSPAPDGPFRDFSARTMRPQHSPAPRHFFRAGSGNVLRSLSIQAKEHLEGLARTRLPQTMGEKYSKVVLACLTCLDANDEDTAAQTSADPDGILIGLHFNEKILGKLNEIAV
ncbi:hypothetical protein VdG1_05187 [Verticillium dahliae VDG1]|nr:hypothetical protein VdG1_05187 [Verticillium dahliae VDG1]